VYALGALAQNIAQAAGAAPDSDGPRKRVSALAYSALDPAFRHWLSGLTSASSVVELGAVWQTTVKIIVQNLANQIIDEAGPAALVGRESGGAFRDAGLALTWFQRRLRKVLPYAFHDKPVTPNKEEAP